MSSGDPEASASDTKDHVQLGEAVPGHPRSRRHGTVLQREAEWEAGRAEPAIEVHLMDHNPDDDPARVDPRRPTNWQVHIVATQVYGAEA